MCYLDSNQNLYRGLTVNSLNFIIEMSIKLPIMHKFLMQGKKILKDNMVRSQEKFLTRLQYMCL